MQYTNSKIDMIKVNVSGCQSFVKEADYKQYVQKALAAFDVLEGEQGAGADFLGWKHLPSEIRGTILADIKGICLLALQSTNS